MGPSVMFSYSSAESRKRDRCDSPESPAQLEKRRKIEQVICKGFNIDTPVNYLRTMRIDRACQEALDKAWKDHVAGKRKRSNVSKEAKKFIACIEGVAEDGSDLYAQKYEIKKSNILDAGNGLFARTDGPGYKKNDVIDLYGGFLTFTHKVEDKEYAFEWPDTAFAAFSVDGKIEGNSLRFMNHIHPKQANVSSVEFFYQGKPYIIFIADKTILPGEEMYYDYGPQYWCHKNVVPQ